MPNEIATAARRLLRSPMFTTVAVVTLAIGIGASAAIFSVVRGVLLKPLPYPDAESLVGVWHTSPEHGNWMHAHVSYLFYRDHSTVFEEMGVYESSKANLTGGERPEELDAVEVSPSLLRVLGVRPGIGRIFLDEASNPDADPVVIISHGLWQRRFGGDPEIVGARVWVDGLRREIVGVMPRGFRVADVDADLILPMEINTAEPERGLWGNICVARLRPGVSRETAQLEADALVARLHEAFPDPEAARKFFERAGIGLAVTSLKDDVVESVSEVLWILFGCVGVVLFVAVANVASLFLVRADVRQHEVALRGALGATRSAIARGMTVESLIVTSAGSAAGLAIAVFGLRAFVNLAPPGIPRLDEVGVDLPVVLFVAAVGVLSGLVFGIVPVIRKTDRLTAALGDGGRGSTGGRVRQRARELLVVAQLALALTLLVTSGLMVRSFFELRAVDPGCDPQGVVAVKLPIPDAEYPQPGDALAFYREVVEKVQALPGVERAGVTTSIPVEDSGTLLGHSFEDAPLDEDEIAPNYITHLVLPGVLDVLSIPLIAGRGLDSPDLREDVRTVVISESLAKRVWSDPADAVGRRVMPGRPQDGGAWYTIAGVVGDAPYGGLAGGMKEALYYPFWSLRVGTEDRLYDRQLDLVIKTSLSPASMARMAADEVWSIDPDIPVADIRTLEEVVAQAGLRTRFTMVLLLVAAGVAVLLGAVGLYGAISYVVSLRTREIGIRVALGADPREVRRMVLGRGLALTTVGLVIGLAAAVAAGRFASSQLFGVSSSDPVTFGLASALLISIALVATYLPARRAAMMDPTEALRCE